MLRTTEAWAFWQPLETSTVECSIASVECSTEHSIECSIASVECSTASNKKGMDILAAPRGLHRRQCREVPFRSSIKSVVVNEDLPLRVAGSLMVTRALGDGYLKRADLSSPPFRQYCPYITADPEVLVYSICSEDDFVILASDGVPYSGNKSLQRRILKLVKSTVILPIFCNCTF